jgi:CO/xanthine dehydrogenase Mo-binding subunit
MAKLTVHTADNAPEAAKPPTIANAVYHATGKRIRDLSITMEKLL